MKASRFTKRHYFLATVTLLLLGVIIVKVFNDSFIRPVVGDYLVVIFQYCLLRFITPLNVRPAAMIVLGFSYLVEIMQFFNILGLLGIKKTLATDLIVGATFDWFDMLAYTLAFFTIIFIEKKFNKSRRPLRRT